MAILEYLLSLPTASLFCFSQYVFTIIFSSVLSQIDLHCHSVAPHRWRHEGFIQSQFDLHCHSAAPHRWRHQGSIQSQFDLHCHSAAPHRWRHQGSIHSARFALSHSRASPVATRRIYAINFSSTSDVLVGNRFLRIQTITSAVPSRLQQQTRGIPTVAKPYLTPWSTVLLDKLTGFQLIKKFPLFYGTQRFITAFTSARHLSLS